MSTMNKTQNYIIYIDGLPTCNFAVLRNIQEKLLHRRRYKILISGGFYNQDAKKEDIITTFNFTATINEAGGIIYAYIHQSLYFHRFHGLSNKHFICGILKSSGPQTHSIIPPTYSKR